MLVFHLLRSKIFLVKAEKSISIALGIIQSIVAISALPAGILMILQPDGSKLGIPIELLGTSPFSDFFIPGLFLFIINGLAQGFAGLSSFLQFKFYRTLGFILGIVLVLWIIIQVYFINPIHYLQVIYFIFGIAEVVLSLYLLNIKKI